MAVQIDQTAIHQSLVTLQGNEQCPRFQDLDAELREYVLLEGLTRAGIPLGYAARDFDNHYPEIQKSLREMSCPPLSMWTMLSGATGSGKTTLLANMARFLFKIWAGNTQCKAYKLPSMFAGMVRFIAFRDFREMIRSFDNQINIGADGLQIFQKVDLLILDDIIQGDTTNWDYQRMYDVIDFRYNCSQIMPMWITTNKSIDDLAKIASFERSYSRLADNSVCSHFELSNEDRRP